MRKILIFIGLFLTLSLSGQILPGIVASQTLVTGGGSPPSYPVELDNAAAWYIADVANYTYIPETTDLNYWNDISGNAENLVDGGVGSRPTGGATYVTFDGVNEAIGNDALSVSTPYIYILVKFNSYVNNDYILRLATTSLIAIQQSATGIKMYTDGGFNGSISTDTDINWGVLRIVINGASSKIQWNSDSPATGNSTTDTMTALRVGLGEGYVNAEMDVMEVIVMPNNAGETDIVTYLTNKIP